MESSSLTLKFYLSKCVTKRQPNKQKTTLADSFCFNTSTYYVQYPSQIPRVRASLRVPQLTLRNTGYLPPAEVPQKSNSLVELRTVTIA